MEDKEIRIHCLDFATRGAGVNGFVPGQIVKQAAVFYDWVIEANQDKPVIKAPVAAKRTHKKARTR